ncbi:MAG TPA: anti-sigma factor [Steroidobacteraceae bacterium]|jgi:anti-sigma-K factor RskA
MNAPIGNEETDLRYAEYALGVLEADERKAVEEEIRQSPRAAQAVERWQSLLAPMADAITQVAPPAHVWDRIREALDRAGEAARPPAAPARADSRARLWDNVGWWRGFALAASVAAIALLLIIVAPRRAPTSAPQPYLTATLQQTNGTAGWTVTVDFARERAILVPASPQPLPAGRAPELWLIPPGGRPQPVGMISRNASTTLPLGAALLSQLSGAGTFAVSVEPPGGSPTGQPTGPVIAQGAVRRG